MTQLLYLYQPMMARQSSVANSMNTTYEFVHYTVYIMYWGDSMDTAAEVTIYYNWVNHTNDAPTVGTS